MLTETQKQTSVEKAEFVLTEIQRVGELLNSGKRPSEIFGGGSGAVVELTAHITHAETQREYTCGQKALKTFSELASIALESRSDSQDFDLNEVAERLRVTFLSFVFKSRDGSIADFIEEWLLVAVSYVAQRHRAYTQSSRRRPRACPAARRLPRPLSQPRRTRHARAR
jgi:hypothetical protein